jgi:hypothetical protein
MDTVTRKLSVFFVRFRAPLHRLWSANIADGLHHGNNKSSVLQVSFARRFMSQRLLRLSMAYRLCPSFKDMVDKRPEIVRTWLPADDSACGRISRTRGVMNNGLDLASVPYYRLQCRPVSLTIRSTSKSIRKRLYWVKW